MERELNWKEVSSTQLFKDKWIDVCSNTYEKQDGSLITPFYIYKFPDFATAVALTKDNKVILERIYRPGIGKTCIELPGGCVDKSDPSLEAAMARELLEETGYRFEKIEYLGEISPNPTTNTNMMRMFLATGGEFDPTQELDIAEDVDVFLVSLKEFMQMFDDNKFVQAMQLSTIFFALKKMGQLKLDLNF